jgi:hypothetical protein
MITKSDASRSAGIFDPSDEKMNPEGGAAPPNMLKQMSSEIVWKEEKTMDI